MLKERVASALNIAKIEVSKTEIEWRITNTCEKTYEREGQSRVGIIVDKEISYYETILSGCIKKIWSENSLPVVIELPKVEELNISSGDCTYPVLVRNIQALKLIRVFKETGINGAIALLHEDDSFAPLLAAELYQCKIAMKKGAYPWYSVVYYPFKGFSIDACIANAFGLMLELSARDYGLEDKERGLRLGSAFLELSKGGNIEQTVFNLARTNLVNAVRIWGSVGGDVKWLLNFSLIASIVGIELFFQDLARVGMNIPLLSSFAKEKEKMLYVPLIALWSRKLLEDTYTIKERWSEKLTASKIVKLGVPAPAPQRASSGIKLLTGNLCEEVIVFEAGLSGIVLDSSKELLFITVPFSVKEILDDPGFRDETVLRSLLNVIDREELMGYLQVTAPQWQPEFSHWRSLDSLRLLRELLELKVLRILLVIYGDTPMATGLPVRKDPVIDPERFPLLGPSMTTLTDGVWGAEQGGLFLASPGAHAGGGIASVEIGDWCWIDSLRGRLELVDKHATMNAWRRGEPPVPVLSRILMSRRILSERLNKLQQLQKETSPNIVKYLEDLVPAIPGLVPGLFVKGLLLEPFLVPEEKTN